MNEEASRQRGKKEGRSPGYPAISLGAAIERANILMEKGKRQYVPLPIIFTYWGYGAKSSMGMLLLSALKKYGLVEDRGSLETREARITDLAWQILVDDRAQSAERDALIREAALNPAIHRKLWNDFNGQLPEDEHLKHILLTKEGFTRGAVDDFIRQFRATIQFAKLEESDKLSGHEADKTSFNEELAMPATEPAKATATEPRPPVVIQEPNMKMGDQRFEVVFTDGEIASVKFPTALKSSEWGAMVRKLLNVVAPEEKAQSRNNEEE